jgi:hypothetical protein
MDRFEREWALFIEYACGELKTRENTQKKRRKRLENEQKVFEPIVNGGK